MKVTVRTGLSMCRWRKQRPDVLHIWRLSNGGPDDPNWVIALCPNCRRRAHYGQDMADFNQRLTRIVQGIEEELV